MLLTVKDGNGVEQVIVTQGRDALTDRSGTIAEAGVSQAIMPANAERAGWFFQNLSAMPMMINEIGDDAALVGSFLVLPLGTFPPPGYPVTITAVSVRCDDSGEGTDDAAGAPFTAREW